MVISHIREFVFLAQTCNYQETAFNLYISQSALSKHIVSIEKELGVCLFDRTTRTVKLSKFGEVFLPYAIKITEIQEEYSSEIKKMLGSCEDSITIGSIPALAEYNITDALIRFKNSGTKCKLNIIQDGSIGLIEKLRSGKCDLAFIRECNELNSEFISIPFVLDSFVAVIPINHPLATKNTISLLELKDDDLLLIEESSLLYKMIIEASQSFGFNPKVSFTDHKIENLLDLAAKEMGVALVMKKHACYHDTKNVKVVDIEPKITSQISLCYNKNANLSDFAKKFIQCSILNT